MGGIVLQRGTNNAAKRLRAVRQVRRSESRGYLAVPD